MSYKHLAKNSLHFALNQLHWAIQNELQEQGLEIFNPHEIPMGSEFHIREFHRHINDALAYSDPWFDQDGYLIRDIPDQCVIDCSHPGPCDSDVARWQKILHFDVPRNHAIRYLKEFGAWDNPGSMHTQELSEIVLWIACCDIKESGEWFGLVS